METNSPASNWLTPNGNPTVKWRGNSLTVLRRSLAVAAEYHAARTAVTRALDAQIAAENEISRTAVGSLLHVDGRHIALGSWDCPESPTLRCVYNTELDRWKDTCVICGEPEYRDR